MSDPAMTGLQRPASPMQMFWVFSRLALQGFGGVIAIAQRELVDRQRWLTAAEFLELLAVSQVLPGPNVVNLSLMLGDRYFGWRGVVASVGGMLLLPMLVVLAAAALYGHWSDLPQVSGALRGMGAVAAGMILATGLKAIRGLRKNPLGLQLSLCYAALTVVLIGALRFPMAAVVLGLGAVTMGHVAWKLRRGASA
ncbi:chromate transporter [uncultured Sphaerotilus sp.]|uniref:chromate transporter n=1 Tax=uncultured Sphaerotilus sp. TaxID=474984 RepID=UPI0030CA3AE8